jgi:PmbA protein
VRDAGYSEETKTVTLKNSRGFDASYTKTGFELSLMVVAEENGQQEMAWESRYEENFSKLDPAALARRTADKVLKQLGAKPIATRKTQALLDASVATSFLGVLSSSFLGDQVRKNRSALRGRLGEKVHGDHITLVDDATLLAGYASRPFDGDGVATRRNVLVQNGVLKSFLYDLSTARQENVPSTGSAVRPHVKEPPRTGTSNFFIEPESGSLEDLLKGMGTGFWVRDVIGVHTADAVSGDFSLGASGLWVEAGVSTQAVRGVTISGNIHQLLSKVTRVGGEVTWYHGFGSPPLVISELEIGGL